ncbi:hypothetical protein LL962_14140 [Xanthomonas sp. NCPPB 1067]|uniref:hypothetical protein n=1 Tax=Xanthomonas TaxID=338 RepID=UPI001E2AE47D|nr:hypothetical protein [Xanthomonas sp. NCPPB 1067]MCC4588229.1 hypothetical protein [Xanthomonas sp. NCPPB 1067]
MRPIRPDRQTLYGTVFSLSIGLMACSSPQHGAQAITPAEALCRFAPTPQDEQPQTDRRDESMQQLTLANGCGAAPAGQQR